MDIRKEEKFNYFLLLENYFIFLRNQLRIIKHNIMDFFERTGKMAIGSRLRMLTDTVTSDASRIYELYGIDIKPKWFPLLFVLADRKRRTVTGIAKEIGHSHPSVSNIVREMTARGLIKEIEDKADKRRTVITLSSRGERIATMLTELCKDVEVAVESISKETRHNLWRAIEEWEDLLAEKSLLQRVKETRIKREKENIEIVPYEACYKEIFKSLNEQWITQHWKIEPHDLDYLDRPQEYIIDKGGFIFVATYKNSPVGVCALCKMDDPIYDYELAKLAVSSDVRGKGIGTLLCEAAINKAKAMNAKTLFLESNTLLKPAIHTYRKLGFKELAEYHPEYERGDIQMELSIQE